MLGGARPVRVSVAVATAGLLLVLPGRAAAVPPAPVLQTDDPVTSDTPHVYWNAAQGVDRYEITRLTGCSSGTSLAAYPTGNTWFDDVFIDQRRPARLGYVVQAHDATGWSAASNCVPVTYDPAPPQLFLGADALADGTISLHWTVNDFSDVTLVLRRGDPGGGAPASATEGNPVCTTPPGSTGCIDTAPASGQRYDYSLFAVDAAGNLAATTASALALDSVPPAAPATLAATPGDGQLALSWAAAADADVTGYRVVWKTGTVAPAAVTDGTAVCDVAVPVVSCSSAGFQNFVAVSLTVFARDEAGNWSIPVPGSSVTATPVAPPATPGPPPQIPEAPDRTPPGRPTRVHVTISPTGVTLRWTNPTARDLAHMVITRNAGHRPLGPGDGRRTVLGRATEATLPAALGARFHLALYAYDRAGNVSKATDVDVAVPKVFPLPAAAIAGRSPRLSWAGVARAAYYNVVITRDGKRVAIGWPTGPSWTPPRLAGGLYRWYVWPGFGSKAAARYGKLIGSSSFRIR